MSSIAKKRLIQISDTESTVLFQNEKSSLTEIAKCGITVLCYGNVGINYDEIGNPTTYLGTTLTWENGKELASYGNYTYEYDLNGVRISKSYTKNGTVYNTAYIVDGSKVMRQSWTAEDGTEYVTDYIYDETGKPRSFGISKNGGAFEYYYFMTSMNGNIMAVLSHGGSVIVEYEYDAWGNIKEIVSDSTVYTAEFQKAVLFRYRGYIYDSESGFYYLNSRYYDPEIGRFINMDNIETVTASPMSLTDKNLYAYCDNNPVMRVDKGGEFWDIVFDVVSLAARVYDGHWYDWSAQADLQLRFSSKTKRMKLYLKYQYQPAATAKF